MKKLLIPIILGVFGLVGGAAAGHFLKPPPVIEEAKGPESEAEAKLAKLEEVSEKAKKAAKDGKEEPTVTYFELTKPLFVPLTHRVGKNSLVRIEIHLEVEGGFEEVAAHHEPKVRDAFLRTLLAFVDKGAFASDGRPRDFTDMRRELLADAQRILGSDVHNVLIAEILHHTG